MDVAEPHEGPRRRSQTRHGSPSIPTPCPFVSLRALRVKNLSGDTNTAEPSGQAPTLATRYEQNLPHPNIPPPEIPQIGSQLNKVSDVSNGMNPPARAGAATRAIDSGVHPSASCTIRTGRGELNRMISFIRVPNT